jgi:hypothetical protein
MRCIFLQKFVLTIFDELLSFFCVEYLIKNVERTPPKWILLSRFDWNIFEGGIVLFESEYFIEKKVFTQKSSYILNGNYKSSFSKYEKYGGGVGGDIVFVLKITLN